MCDYCDCRSQPEIAALSADHERIGALLAAISRAVVTGDRDRQRTLVDELREVLVPHAEREERGIFAALRAAAIDERYLDRLEGEHEELHRLLGRADDPTYALRVVQLLRDHILQEESDLFPAARQLLSASQWQTIAGVSDSLYPTTLGGVPA